MYYHRTPVFTVEAVSDAPLFCGYACRFLDLNLLSMSTSSPSQPSLPWRAGSACIMGISGSLSRLIMFGTNSTEIHGLDGFLKLLDERKDVEKRKRGLITSKFSRSMFAVASD